MTCRFGVVAAAGGILAAVFGGGFEIEARNQFPCTVAADPPTANDPFEDVLEKVRPKPAEERWRLIPWHHSLKKGFAAAAQAGKPVFFFGYDGTLDNGNC